MGILFANTGLGDPLFPFEQTRVGSEGNNRSCLILRAAAVCCGVCEHLFKKR